MVEDIVTRRQMLATLAGIQLAGSAIDMAKRTVLGYICGVTFQWELGECEFKVYPSVEALKESGDCWIQCGIVELAVTNDGKWKPKWVEKQKPFKAGKVRVKADL